MKAETGVKQTNTGNRNEAVQHPSGKALQRSQKQASVEIKHNQQHLTGARQKDRYNRLSSSFHCCVENWMWFPNRSVSNIIFMGRSLYCLLHNTILNFYLHASGDIYFTLMENQFTVVGLRWSSVSLKNFCIAIFSFYGAGCVHSCSIHSQHFIVWCRMQSERWHLLICCEQILEIANE